MPIGPRGEPLPYPNNGATQPGGPPFDPRAMNPGVGTGPALPPVRPPVGNPMGAQPGGGVDSLMNELMQLTQRAEQIISQLEAQGVNPEQLLAGGGPEGGVPVGPPGGMPRMPVGGNTGLPGGMPGLIA